MTSTITSQQAAGHNIGCLHCGYQCLLAGEFYAFIEQLGTGKL